MSGFNKAALTNLLAEFGRDTLIEQGDYSTALVDFGQIPGKDKKDSAKIFDKVPGRKPVGRVNPIKGGVASGGITQGGATRRAPRSSNPKPGTYQHVMFEQDIDFDEDIVMLGDLEGGIDATMAQLRIAGSSFARLLERALISHKLSNVNQVVGVGANVTVNVQVVAGLRPNMLVDRYDAAGTTRIQANMEITDVVDNGDGTGVITVASLSPASAIGEQLFIAGSGGTGNPFASNPTRNVNLYDITAPGVVLYQGLTLADQPPGLLVTDEGSWSNRGGRRLMGRLSAGVNEKATHILVHPYQAQEIYESQNQSLQFRPGDTLDVYGPRMTFDGAEIVECNSQNEDRIDFINARSYAAQIHEFWGPRPTGSDGKAGPWTKDSLQLSQDRHSLTLFLSAAYNMRVTRRDAFAAMTGLSVTQ